MKWYVIIEQMNESQTFLELCALLIDTSLDEEHDILKLRAFINSLKVWPKYSKLILNMSYEFLSENDKKNKKIILADIKDVFSGIPEQGVNCKHFDKYWPNAFGSVYRK